VVVVVTLEVSFFILVLLFSPLSPEEPVVISVFVTFVISAPEPSPPFLPLLLLVSVITSFVVVVSTFPPLPLVDSFKVIVFSVVFPEFSEIFLPLLLICNLPPLPPLLSVLISVLVIVVTLFSFPPSLFKFLPFYFSLISS